MNYLPLKGEARGVCESPMGGEPAAGGARRWAVMEVSSRGLAFSVYK